MSAFRVKQLQMLNILDTMATEQDTKILCAMIKCNRCKHMIEESRFKVMKAGKRCKCCDECRGTTRNYMKDYNANRVIARCPHGKFKDYCFDCGGSQMCIHGTKKNTCRDCGGSRICEHDRRVDVCRDCGGSQICEHGNQRWGCKKCKDPIRITLMNMIYNARASDKKSGLYDANVHVDICFLESLVEEFKETNMKCEYCPRLMQFMDQEPSMISLERRDNAIGHSKANCTFACLLCNVSRVGQRAI